jgi:hypothetical protein
MHEQLGQKSGNHPTANLYQPIPVNMREFFNLLSCLSLLVNKPSYPSQLYALLFTRLGTSTFIPKI